MKRFAFKGPRKQRGFINIASVIQWFARKPFDIREAFRSGEPGLHLETYDPNTILRRRNRLTYSQVFTNAAWLAGASTTTDNVAVAPDGTMTAGKLVDSVTNTSHSKYQATTCQVGVPITQTWHLKAAELSWAYIRHFDGITNTGAWFDLANGLVGTVNAGISASITPAGNGWYRCAITVTPAATTERAQVQTATADGVVNYAGTGTEGILMWGVQFEYGSSATTYQLITDWNTEFLAAGGNRVALFQDSAGLVPNTAPEQPVGLWLDMKYGGVRGPELKASGVVGLLGVATAASYDTVTGVGSATRVDASNQSWVRLPGMGTDGWAELTIQNTGGVTINVRNTSASGPIPATVGAGLTSTVKVPTVGSGGVYLTASSAATISFVVISVKALPGNHASQSSAGARPTFTQRVNLLIKSEQFDDPAWTKTDTTVTADNTTAPNGTTTADLLTEGVAGTAFIRQGITSITSSVYKARRVIKRGNHDWVSVCLADATFSNQVRQWVNLATGTLGVSNIFGGGGATLSSVSIENLGNGWYAVNLAGQIGATTTLISFTHSATGDGLTNRVNNATRYEWGADVRTASDAAKPIPLYQRVNTSTDYDTEGFPPRVVGNGTSHWMSAPLDLSSTDKVCVVATVTKNSDTAFGMVYEHGPAVSSTNGTFNMRASNTTGTGANSFSVELRGATGRQWRGHNGVTAPITTVQSSVLGTSSSVAYSELQLRSNNIEPAMVGIDNTPPGGGNFSNQTIYLFSRAGTGSYFNGGISSLTIRGGGTTDGLLANLQQYAKNIARLVY